MKKVELEARVKDFIQQHNLISPGEALVVGVSGGADSVCLLHLLARWREELGVKLHLAHLDHQLRGAESEADARYVAGLASSLGIPATIDRQDVAVYRTKRNCSIEEAARELRYAFLAKVANDVGANRVAIGHTRDDQVETILMHILRGTGTSGLRGLEPCSPIPSKSYQHVGEGLVPSLTIFVIRPLLNITRQETLNYCQEYQLEPRIDSSNLSLAFLRNRLRLELLPLLRKYNPKVDEALLRLAEIAKDDNSFMEQQALGLWGEVARQEGGAVYLDKGKIIALPLALQRRLLRLAIAKILGDTRDIEINHIEAVRSLLSKPVGKRISLPHGLVCWSEYNEIIIARSAGACPPLDLLREDEADVGEGLVPSLTTAPKNQSQLPFPPCPFPPFPVLLSGAKNLIPLKIPGETILPGWKVVASIVYEQTAPLSLRAQENVGEGLVPSLVAEFDLHQTGTELFVRQRQPGDRFQPLGMNMPKKLQEFMIDAKIPLSWRDNIPIVCSPSYPIWVVGWRIDDKVKVTEATKEILRLEFIKLS